MKLRFTQLILSLSCYALYYFVKVRATLVEKPIKMFHSLRLGRSCGSSLWLAKTCAL